MTVPGPTHGAGPDAPADSRRALEAKADLVRAHLLDDVDRLREKARRELDLAEMLRRHGGAVLLAVGATVVLGGVSGAVIAHRAATRKERARHLRLDAWMRLIRHPELAAPPPKSFGVKLLERAATAGVVSIIAVVARRYASHLLSPDRRVKVSSLPLQPDPFPSAPASARR